MVSSRFAVIAAVAAMFCSAAKAEEKQPFTGPYAGPAVGAVDHHFVIEEQDEAGRTRRANVTRWGVGGEVFGGFDLAVVPRVRLGIEGQFEVGGRAATQQNSSFTVGIKPRYGLSVSVRTGYLVSRRLLLYAGAGYGRHYYRVIEAGNIAGDDLTLTRSFILRGGAEMRLTRSAGVRLEFEHLDGTRNQFMLGVPIRF